ncbi:protein FAR1-RELATED SEQUENCE 5-like [Argentina anserina]|uniref:protein FAR1-RELATED SEQUENCE 5-like n=1 Tax=Argentina anserina TaxID=57926 RepID=UPI0021765DE7|nr:protein FAR1-RELATED SEQUENCE 5-like [Potentilla anserina]
MKESLASRIVIQALLEELGQAGFSYDIEYDQDGRLTHLMFAHPLSIALTKSYTNVFVMDCTYKTNKYKMPLLDIVGVTSFNTTFYSYFIFIQREEEENYVQALTLFSKILGADVHLLVIISDRELALMNAINIVFPRTTNILCVWHIERNIAINCKRHIEEEADWVALWSTWTSLINSHDGSSFNEAWINFEVEYKQKGAILDYIRGTWLPLKEKLVIACTGKISHFGNRATSRGEGAHSILKKYLQVSNGGIREVKDKVCLAIENQFAEIKVQLSNEKIHHPHKVGTPFFKELVTRISIFALDQLQRQYEFAKSRNLSSQCKCHFYKTMGIPCAHMIKDRNFEAPQLNSIHEQWRIDTRSFGVWLDKGDEIDVLLSKVKSHPVGSKNKKSSSSTKRDPSAFEIVEKKSQKCSFFHDEGHDVRTCKVKGIVNYCLVSNIALLRHDEYKKSILFRNGRTINPVFEGLLYCLERCYEGDVGYLYSYISYSDLYFV